MKKIAQHNSKKLRYIGGLLVIAVVLITGFWISNRSQTPDSDNKNSENSARQVEEGAPKPPTTGTIEKSACEYFDEQLAKQTLGDKATKSDKATAVSSLTYNTSICEYRSGEDKAVITIYRHPDKANVAKTMADLQSRKIASKSKDSIVVSSEVTVSTKVDTQKSEKLLGEVANKL